MYSLKQAQLLMGSLPLADITIYYIDIRSFGKGYDEFYEQAKGMGVFLLKAKWHASKRCRAAIYRYTLRGH
jgi:heterodisulfide reductase subunit A